MTETRKLAAILAADVAGYSKLAGADEERTLARLRALWSDLIAPTITVHHGRVVKRTGDGSIIEFRSVVEAVRCAIEVQNGMAERNAGLPPERRIEFRVGIHLGDVVEESDGDLMGDGVNIAARLEGIAKPGAICLSEDAYRQVKGRIDLSISDLGQTQLKNIVDPIRVYSLEVGVPAEAKLTTPAKDALAQRGALSEVPSIAVLPFQNMSGDADQEYFADGMVEEIITALSRFRSLIVITRNSSFTYKGRAVDVKQAGRELGVGYVLEGSVRKAANRVRITVQLIDCSTGAHLWADRFDGALEDIFDLQDKIAASVVGAIAPKLEQVKIEHAKRKPTDKLDAYDYYLQALSHLGRLSLHENDAAIRLAARAAESDPSFALPLALGAYCYVIRRSQAWQTDAKHDVAEGVRLAKAALALDQVDASVLAYAGHALGQLGRDYDAAIVLVNRALSLNPNLAIAHLSAGWLQNFLGNPQAALEHFDRQIRLSPLDPVIKGFATGGAAQACIALGRYSEALTWAQQAAQDNPDFLPGILALVAALVLTGRVPEAASAGKRIIELMPRFRISLNRARAPHRETSTLDQLYDGLRKAGLPE